MDTDRLNNYLSKIAQEISVASDRINDLIDHPQVKGNYREYLLKSVLKKYLPKKYDVGTGFIIGCPRQCDILIYDCINYFPIFKEDDLIVIHPKAIRAVIEVKTSLNSKFLKEGLELINDVSKLLIYPKPAFKAIFSFNTNYTTAKPSLKIIKDFYNGDLNKNIATFLFQTIDCICVPNKFLLFSSLRDLRNENSNEIEPYIYAMTSKNKNLNIETAIFLFQLFKFLDIDKFAKQMNYEVFNKLGLEANYSNGEKIYTSKWEPTHYFKDMNSFIDLDINQLLHDVVYWQFGDLSSLEFENKYLK